MSKWLLPAMLALSSPALAHDGPHAAAHGREGAGPALPPGSNEMMRAPIVAAPDLEVIVSDVIIPAGSQVPRHYHPGEEFLYLIEGSAIHVEEGKPDRLYKAGESFVIPPRAIHEPIGGPQGARAIAFRVHVKGQPERFLVPRDGAAPATP